MNMESKVLYCRLCAEEKKIDVLIDLQVNPIECKGVVQRLNYLKIGIDIVAGNQLPKTVCYVCYESLQTAYNFISKLQNAQLALIKIFTETNDDEDNAVDDNDSSSNEYEDDVIKEETLDVKEEVVDDLSFNVDVVTEKLDAEGNPEKPDMFEIKGELDIDTSEVGKADDVPNLNVEDLIKETFCDDTASVELQWYAKELVDKSWKSYSWVCRHCLIEFPSLPTLRSHSKEIHRNCLAFVCMDCDKQPTNFEAFLTHVRLHRKYLKHRCPYCDTAVKKKTEKSHMEVHFKETNMPCHLCGEILQDTVSLEEHMNHYLPKKSVKSRRKRGLPITMDDLTCKVCKKVYKNRNSLRDHQILHNTDRKRDYTCERCGKAFFSKGTLMSHIMSHDSLRPHTCKICNKSFLFPNMLRRHVEMHSGVKPYSCEQCGRGFRLQYQLKAHRIIHTDEMPFMCQFCSKSFRFKQILKNHERQHTGSKPYSCEICHMDFTNWSNYNKHMKRRHATDTSKKKITPVGIFPINPTTGKMIEIEDPVATEEWKMKIMAPSKRGKKEKLKSK